VVVYLRLEREKLPGMVASALHPTPYTLHPTFYTLTPKLPGTVASVEAGDLSRKEDIPSLKGKEHIHQPVYLYIVYYWNSYAV